MEIANKVGVLKSFSLICIDGNEDYYVKNKGLKGTPTIIMIQQKIKLEKKECLDWLKNYIMAQENNKNHIQQDAAIPGIYNSNNSNANNNSGDSKYISRNNIIKRNNKLNDNNNNKTYENNQQTAPSVTQINNQLIGFIGKEMTGHSDEYAYLACDNPMPKSFLAPKSDFHIYTAPENGKIDKQKQDIYMSNLETRREETKNEIISSFKSQHQNYNKNGSNHKWFDENN
jgi:hypothetical protein